MMRNATDPISLADWLETLEALKRLTAIRRFEAEAARRRAADAVARTKQADARATAVARRRAGGRP